MTDVTQAGQFDATPDALLTQAGQFDATPDALFTFVQPLAEAVEE